ncbi:MAG: alanyl-tRNA editing protein [Lachnospiraceae bacterium]|nr:alanyl-tRNA editing protein [Lachnospiraceae bacterium]
MTDHSTASDRNGSDVKITQKRYETDGMLRECTAVVTGYENADGKHYITLDQTIFAPEGGGQKADLGELIVSGSNETVQVLDGHDRVKNCSLQGPVYLVSREIPVGTSVLCKLDWDLRFMRMQQHSGEHVMSGLIHQHFGYNNVSFHLSDSEPVILCFDGVLTREDVLKMETLANEAVCQNIPILVSYPAKEELDRITYRSKIEIAGQVRLVSIEGVDVCACCAPHVPTTGHIGLIKVLSIASYKGGGTQVNILCGKRAQALVQNEHELLTEISREYSTAPEELMRVILAEREDLRKTKEQLASITEAKLLKEVAALSDRDEPCLFAPSLTPHALKICYNALTDRFEKFCGVFSGTDEEGYQFYAGHPALDSTLLAAKMREHLQAKGGGSKDMIQGKLAKKEEEIRLFFRELS